MYQELIDYIKKAREVGKSDWDIKSDLSKSGWRSEDIDEAFGTVFYGGQEQYEEKMQRAANYRRFFGIIAFLAFGVWILVNPYLKSILVVQIFGWAILIGVVLEFLSYDWKNKKFRSWSSLIAKKKENFPSEKEKNLSSQAPSSTKDKDTKEKIIIAILGTLILFGSISSLPSILSFKDSVYLAKRFGILSILTELIFDGIYIFSIGALYYVIYFRHKRFKKLGLTPLRVTPIEIPFYAFVGAVVAIFLTIPAWNAGGYAVFILPAIIMGGAVAGMLLIQPLLELGISFRAPRWLGLISMIIWISVIISGSMLFLSDSMILSIQQKYVGALESLGRIFQSETRVTKEVSVTGVREEQIRETKQLAAESWNNYLHPNYNIKIFYPSDWKIVVDFSSSDSLYFTSVDYEIGKSGAKINFIFGLTNNEKLDSVVAAMYGSQAKNETVSLDGRSALKTTYDARPEVQALSLPIANGEAFVSLFLEPSTKTINPQYSQILEEMAKRIQLPTELTGQWQVYTDPQGGFQFEHPPFTEVRKVGENISISVRYGFQENIVITEKLPSESLATWLERTRPINSPYATYLKEPTSKIVNSYNAIESIVSSINGATKNVYLEKNNLIAIFSKSINWPDENFIQDYQKILDSFRFE